MQNNRLDKLDSWRAICCLGVLWIHCWHLNNSIQLNLFGINIAKPLSIVGNGVDFFFVISGFCMYYFYINKFDNLNLKTYSSYILSRAYRILPSFFIALVVYSICYNTNLDTISRLKIIGINLLSLQNFSNTYEISSHFWFIAVVWQFYIVFPIIIYFNLNQNNFVAYITIITVLISIMGVIMLTNSKNYDLQLPVRFVEFSVGVIIAFYYKKFNNIQHSNFNIALGFALLFIGRLLNVDSILNFTESEVLYSITKIVGYFLMTAGFAILLYYSISDTSRLFLFLNWKPLVFIGRISYSFYLWHGLALSITWYLFNNFGWSSVINPVQNLLLQFLVSLLLTIPVSLLSFTLIEKRFKYSAKS